MAQTFKILAVGDVVGRSGRQVLKDKLQGIVDVHRIDMVIVNGENAAGGKSITPEIAQEFFSIGTDVITTGNHIWDNSEALKIIDSQPALLRPANYPEGVRGHGHCIIERKGFRVCVVNLQGRLFMEPIDCPFRKFDRIYETVKDSADVIVVDFHAEATSEKKALGWYLDGRATAVFGTHTPCHDRGRGHPAEGHRVHHGHRHDGRLRLGHRHQQGELGQAVPDLHPGQVRGGRGKLQGQRDHARGQQGRQDGEHCENNCVRQ